MKIEVNISNNTKYEKTSLFIVFYLSEKSFMIIYQLKLVGINFELSNASIDFDLKFCGEIKNMKLSEAASHIYINTQTNFLLRLSSSHRP